MIALAGAFTAGFVIAMGFCTIAFHRIEVLQRPKPDFVHKDYLETLFLDVKLGRVKPIQAAEILIGNHLDGITFDES